MHYQFIKRCKNSINIKVKEWGACGIPLSTFMNMELRSGKMKPVLKKYLVDLNTKSFKKLKESREKWKYEVTLHFKIIRIVIVIMVQYNLIKVKLLMRNHLLLLLKINEIIYFYNYHKMNFLKDHFLYRNYCPLIDYF
jgi:hypothetical protein